MRNFQLLFSVFYFVATAAAQVCPSPTLISGNLLTVQIPNDNLPVQNIEVSFDNAGNTVFPYGDGANNSHAVATQFGSDSLSQIYVVDVKLLPSGLFSRKPVIIANRRTTTAGEDTITVARFGASSAAGNFVLTFSVFYDANGAFLPPGPQRCSSPTSLRSFNSEFFEIGISRPKTALRYFGDFASAQYHNSLFQ